MLQYSMMLKIQEFPEFFEIISCFLSNGVASHAIILPGSDCRPRFVVTYADLKMKDMGSSADTCQAFTYMHARSWLIWNVRHSCQPGIRI